MFALIQYEEITEVVLYQMFTKRQGTCVVSNITIQIITTVIKMRVFKVIHIVGVM